MKQLLKIAVFISLFFTLFNEVQAQYIDVTTVTECTTLTNFNTTQCTAAFEATRMNDNNESGATCMLYATGFFADALASDRSQTRFESAIGVRYQFTEDEASAAASCSSSAYGSSSSSTGILSDWKTFFAIQELQARKAITDNIVDNVFIADDPELTPEDVKARVSATLTSSHKSFDIPVSYSYSSTLQLVAALPVTYLNDEFLMGNIAASATWYSGSLDDQLILTSAYLELPTGDKEIGGGGLNAQISQSRAKDLEEGRGFLGYSYRYTAEVDKLNTGDTINIAAGLDTLLDYELPVVGKNYSCYGIATVQIINESKYNGYGLGDERKTADLTAGLIWRPMNLRFGLTIPIITMADNISNSDRLMSLDVGFRFGGSGGSLARGAEVPDSEPIDNEQLIYLDEVDTASATDRNTVPVTLLSRN